MHQILLKPIITENSMDAAGKGKFTFLVARSANKNVIKRVIEKKFNVNVIGISTTIVKGRGKRVGARRIEIVQTPFKKAVVALKEGQKIAMFDLNA